MKGTVHFELDDAVIVEVLAVKRKPRVKVKLRSAKSDGSVSERWYNVGDALHIKLNFDGSIT